MRYCREQKQCARNYRIEQVGGYKGGIAVDQPIALEDSILHTIELHQPDYIFRGYSMSPVVFSIMSQ